jgi:phage protein D
MSNQIKPIYEILHAEKSGNLDDEPKNLTQDLRPFIKSIKLIDQIDGAADRLTIQIADPQDIHKLPTVGGKIRIKFGYSGNSLTAYGDYTIEDFEFSGVSTIFEMVCTSVDFSSKLYQRRTEAYENMTLEGLAKVISIREEYEDLKLNYDIRLNSSGVSHHYISQTNESDLHLLNRMSEKEGADFNIKSGVISITERNKTTFKDKYAPMTLRLDEITFYAIDHNNRYDYSSVIAKWWNPKEAILEGIQYPEDANEEGVSFVIERIFQDDIHAAAEARGQLLTLKRKQKLGQIIMPGKPGIFAGTVINLAPDKVNERGFRRMLKKDNNGKEIESKEFTVTQVEHTMDDKGWQMRLKLRG